MTGLPYPHISPIMLSIGPIDIRWYSMAYLVGIISAWYLIFKNIKKYNLPISKSGLDDVIFYVTLGIILGGRLGYVLFYSNGIFLQKPLEIFAIWHGGMSFHGGLTGAIAGLYFSARKIHYPFLKLTDLAALYTPIGLFLGRLANFANDELWGRVTQVPWAVRFPNGGFLPRHPSQLYEAFFEGLILFILLNLLWKKESVRQKSGFISGVFLVFYALSRIFVEFFREPDAQIGYILNIITMGQILSLPIFIIGLILIIYSFKKSQNQA